MLLIFHLILYFLNFLQILFMSQFCRATILPSRSQVYTHWLPCWFFSAQTHSWLCILYINCRRASAIQASFRAKTESCRISNPSLSESVAYRPCRLFSLSLVDKTTRLSFTGTCTPWRCSGNDYVSNWWMESNDNVTSLTSEVRISKDSLYCHPRNRKQNWFQSDEYHALSEVLKPQAS